MLVELAELVPGKRYSGLVAGTVTTVIAVEVHGASSATVTYRTPDGQLGESVLTNDDLVRIIEARNKRIAELGV